MGAEASDWEEVLSVKGVYPNQVVSNTIDIKPNGLYHVVVTDAAQDGFCCQYRNGFITVTTTKEINNGDNSVVFQHNGNFEDSVEVYLVASSDGNDIDVQ